MDGKHGLNSSSTFEKSKLKGNKTQLMDERIAGLNEIGFSWVAPGFTVDLDPKLHAQGQTKPDD